MYVYNKVFVFPKIPVWAVGLLPTLLELCVDVAILMPGIFLKSKNFLWTWTVLSHIYLLRGIQYYNFFYRSGFSQF